MPLASGRAADARRDERIRSGVRARHHARSNARAAMNARDRERRAHRAGARRSRIVRAGPGGRDPGAGVPAERRRALPVVVWFHGGGWVTGSLETHDLTCRLLCADGRRDRRVGRLPARARDEVPGRGRRLRRRVVVGRRARSRARRSTRRAIAIGGDSAGGNLAAVVALVARDGEARRRPCIQLLVYPVTDYEFERRRWSTTRPATSSKPTPCAGSTTTTRAPKPTAPTGACRRCARPTSPASARDRAHRRVRPAARSGRGVRRALQEAGVPDRDRARRRPVPRLLRDAQVPAAGQGAWDVAVRALRASFGTA